jgi:hypothetical protein
MRSKVVAVVLALYSVFFLVAAFAFIGSHGGLKGDFDRSLLEADPHSLNVYAGRVYFNRWIGSSERDPWIYKQFLRLNIPADLVAHAAYKIVQIMVPEFREPFPFGISYVSYTRGLMLLVAPVQWLLVGLLLSRSLRSRHSLATS